MKFYFKNFKIRIPFQPTTLHIHQTSINETAFLILYVKTQKKQKILQTSFLIFNSIRAISFSKLTPIWNVYGMFSEFSENVVHRIIVYRNKHFFIRTRLITKKLNLFIESKIRVSEEE